MAFSGHDLLLSINDPSSSLPPGFPRITSSSPLRDVGPDSMDYERCAALHNELLTKVVRALGGEMPCAPLSWWEARAPPDEVANALHPSLIEFLKRALDEDVMPTMGFLFVFLGALKFPEGFFRDEESYSIYDETGRFLKLYESSHFRLGDDEGLLYVRIHAHAHAALLQPLKVTRADVLTASTRRL